MKTIPSFVQSVVFGLALAVASAFFVPRAAYAQSKVLTPEESPLNSDQSEAKEMFAVVGEKYNGRIAIAQKETENEDKYFRVTYSLLSYNAEGKPVIEPLKDLQEEAVLERKQRRANVSFTPTKEMADKSVLVRVQLLDKKGGTPVSLDAEGYGLVAVKPAGFTGGEPAGKDQDIRTVKSPIGVGRR